MPAFPSILMRAPKATLRILVILAASGACQAGTPARIDAPARLDVRGIVASGDSASFALVLQRIAHERADAGMTADLIALLDSPDARVRARAACLLGAAGPAAVDAAPTLRRLTTDSSDVVRAEAAFALGAVRAADSLSLDALYRLATTDPSPLVAARATTAVPQLRRKEPIVPSAAMARTIRLLLGDADAVHRQDGIHLAGLISAPWKRPALRILLRDTDPNVRIAAGWAVARMGQEGKAARDEVAQLARDSVPWVRANAPRMLASLERGVDAPVYRCLYRRVATFPDGSDEVQHAVLTVLPSSASIRDDGRGPYENADGVRSAHKHGYHLMLPMADSDPQLPLAARHPQGAARWMALDLTQPVNGAPNRGVQRDSSLHLGVFFMRDINGYVWSTRDIPVGTKVRSDHTSLLFQLNGEAHLLQFGTWSLGDCGSRLGNAHGVGTGTVMIERRATGEFHVTASAGTVGRLWNYANPARARDLGLYRFAFELEVRTDPYRRPVQISNRMGG